MSTKKICVVTGANSGIGKQAAGQIAEKGYHVVLACRSKERGEAALADIQQNGGSAELMLLDLGLTESIRSFAADYRAKFNRLDVLIHNAAVFNVTQKEQEKTAEGVETVWATNHLGPVLLTDLLLDLLKESGHGRIITISSQGLVAKPFLKIDLEDPEFSHKRYSVVNAYYQSKRAQVMYTYWLAEKLANTNVTVNCIRVTAVKVDLERHSDLSPMKRRIYAMKSKMSISPEEMAKTYTWLATSPDVTASNGKYYNEKNEEVNSVRYCNISENRDAVMRLTYAYLKEKPVEQGS